MHKNMRKDTVSRPILSSIRRFHCPTSAKYHLWLSRWPMAKQRISIQVLPWKVTPFYSARRSKIVYSVSVISVVILLIKSSCLQIQSLWGSTWQINLPPSSDHWSRLRKPPSLCASMGSRMCIRTFMKRIRKRLCRSCKHKHKSSAASSSSCVPCSTPPQTSSPPLRANASVYYQTMDFPHLSDLVWHEAWNHADVETMVAIVKDPANPTFDNVPKALTPQVIRKYFPSCVACPFGNLSARPLPRKSTSKASIGEEWEVDIKGRCRRSYD